jgi:hypothetical protein
MKKSNGYVLHETEHIVVIATGFRDYSHNRKTGAMIQTWILIKAVDPVQAIPWGWDNLNCGDCPLRGHLGRERACYVNVGQAPLQIYRSWQRGNYSRLTGAGIPRVFAGRSVRFGAYGEPVLIPIEIVQGITAVSSGWTGYTHMWHKPEYAEYKEFFMASTNAADFGFAQTLGWRTFTVSDIHIDTQVICPASAEAGHRTTCDQCRLCGGTSINARSIQIRPHGRGARYAV